VANYSYIRLRRKLVFEEVEALSEKPAVDPEKTKAMQERARERSLIVREMKSQGPSTVEKLSQATGIEKSKLLKHLIAMGQFGKVSIVGEQDNQFVYALPKEGKQ
jgi:predicted ArsR family transcriptional regulator